MTRRSPPDPEADQAGSFPEARAVHEDILSAPESYPSGWVEQAQFRDRNDLPPFRPPRFNDGVRVRSTIEDLETDLDVSIDLIAYDVRTDGWWVEIDGDPAFSYDRYRDDGANTVIQMDAATFRERVRTAVDERSG
jgi:hypothetical protein